MVNNSNIVNAISQKSGQSAMGRPAPEFSGCRKKLYLYSEHSLRQYEGTNREYIT